jgi:hypothetical protein
LTFAFKDISKSRLIVDGRSSSWSSSTTTSSWLNIYDLFFFSGLLVIVAAFLGDLGFEWLKSTPRDLVVEGWLPALLLSLITFSA